MTPERHERSVRHRQRVPRDRRADGHGWLTMNWPNEYGHQDRSPIGLLIFTDEAAHLRARARWCRRRHRSPGAPVLPGYQGSRVRLGRSRRASSADRAVSRSRPRLIGRRRA
ncbi:MAG: hypothetical protein K2X97_09930 [Mycobacteriaceae bacterium]|nr:hypothetical protein [Mycobacteriaceae bacterium]